jgi:hypothetical protein
MKMGRARGAEVCRPRTRNLVKREVAGRKSDRQGGPACEAGQKGQPAALDARAGLRRVPAPAFGVPKGLQPPVLRERASQQRDAAAGLVVAAGQQGVTHAAGKRQQRVLEDQKDLCVHKHDLVRRHRLWGRAEQAFEVDPPPAAGK